MENIQSSKINGGNSAAGLSRGTFLRRVKKALGHSETTAAAAPSDHPVMVEALVRQVPSDDSERVQRWEQLAKNNGMKVERTAADGVPAAIERALAKHAEIKRVMLCTGELGATPAVENFLRGKSFAVEKWGTPDCRTAVFHCDASITDCQAGLADTGALLVWSDAGFGRSVTLTSPVHIVLLRNSQVLGDMVDGFAFLLRQTGESLPSNVVIINGPSKTADIEMNLVTGVHGPKYLYVILIEDKLE